jgi:hypothetical protein
MKDFKKFYLKNTDQLPKHDPDISEALLEICRELYSQNQNYSPEDLLRISSDNYVQKEIEFIRNKISDSSVYLLEEIREKFPVKELNNPKEELNK